MESNDSPEIPDRGKTSDIPGLPSGGTGEENDGNKRERQSGGTGGDEKERVVEQEVRMMETKRESGGKGGKNDGDK